MQNQKELKNELDGLSYLPNQTNSQPAKETTIFSADTVDITSLTIRQKIAKAIQDLKSKGKTFSPKLKKLATSALAGSLVAAMLFLGSCEKMDSMEQNYPQSVVNILAENGYTSQDYDAKKQEFLNANPADLDCGLQVVPHNYYKEKFGLTDQEISKRVFGGEVFFVDNSLYVAAKYVPTLEKLGVVKEGEDWNNNKDVLDAVVGFPTIVGTLFKYDLEPEIYEALKSAYTSKDRVSNSKAVDSNKYINQTYENSKILDGKIMIRQDRVNNFQYRYLLDSILSSYTPTVLGSEVYNGTSVFNVSKNDDSGIAVMDQYMMSGYPYIKDGYLYVYFIGKYLEDPKMEKYLFTASVKLDGQDFELIDKNGKILGVPYKLTDMISNAKKSGKTVYYNLVDKCEVEPKTASGENAVGRIAQDFYEHGGRSENLGTYNHFTWQ